jgi:predicted kinase
MIKDSPQIIMVMGLPGSGKTYFAKALAKKLPGLLINSDIVRKQQQQYPQYSGTDKAQVYKEMHELVHKALKTGKKVILDATFSLDKYRRPFYELADRHHLMIKLIMIKSDERTINQRLKKKRRYSDADFSVYKKIKSEFEPISLEHLILATDKLSLDEMIATSLEFIQETSADE